MLSNCFLSGLIKNSSAVVEKKTKIFYDLVDDVKYLSVVKFLKISSAVAGKLKMF